MIDFEYVPTENNISLFCVDISTTVFTWIDSKPVTYLHAKWIQVKIILPKICLFETDIVEDMSPDLETKVCYTISMGIIYMHRPSIGSIGLEYIIVIVVSLVAHFCLLFCIASLAILLLCFYAYIQVLPLAT